MSALAEVHWSGSPEDRAALSLRHDWSGLKGLEQLWPELARRYGEQPALAAPHTRPPEAFTYRQLQERIEQGAAGLAALGVGPGDVVALLAENSPRWLVADQALMRVGAADAVRGSGAPLAELRYILDDSGAVALVVESAALLARLELTPEHGQRLRAVILLEDHGAKAAGPEAAAPGVQVLDGKLAYVVGRDAGLTNGIADWLSDCSGDGSDNDCDSDDGSDRFEDLAAFSSDSDSEDEEYDPELDRRVRRVRLLTRNGTVGVGRLGEDDLDLMGFGPAISEKPRPARKRRRISMGNIFQT
jgi:acyl-CoA synthetase (AMP-forming)/AMP-acid ligase II